MSPDEVWLFISSKMPPERIGALSGDDIDDLLKRQAELDEANDQDDEFWRNVSVN